MGEIYECYLEPMTQPVIYICTYSEVRCKSSCLVKKSSTAKYYIGLRPFTHVGQAVVSNENLINEFLQ